MQLRVLLLIAIISVSLQDRLVFRPNSPSNYYLINIRRTDTFTFKLKGNMTTGFAWYLKEMNDKYLNAMRLAENKMGAYVTDPNPNGLMGVGGTFSFRFRPIKTGQTVLKFEYKRSWSTDFSRVITITVNIQ